MFGKTMGKLNGQISRFRAHHQDSKGRLNFGWMLNVFSRQLTALLLTLPYLGRLYHHWAEFGHHRAGSQAGESAYSDTAWYLWCSPPSSPTSFSQHKRSPIPTLHFRARRAHRPLDQTINNLVKNIEDFLEDMFPLPFFIMRFRILRLIKAFRSIYDFIQLTTV